MEEEGINPLAKGLNRTISEISPSIFSCLSELGKRMYFPSGILAQSADAKQRASKFNATIGIALENNVAMHLGVTEKYFNNLHPNNIYPYAPPEGLAQLRAAWKEKLIRNNPSLANKAFSLPMVTQALTNGLSLTADLIANPGDVVVLPDKYWGVYNLNFSTRKGCEIATYETFDEQGQFNTKAFRNAIQAAAATRDKLILVLNFPNNPTGYTPSVEKSAEIFKIVADQAEKGTKIITIADDSYFGLFYEDCNEESLFSKFCDLHENILAIKVDGATKECFAWGFRTGFLTCGTKTHNPQTLYSALETKIKGLIRSTISSSNHPSQTILLKALEHPDFEDDIKIKFEILKKRALHLKKILNQEKFKDEWTYYPFNSGYFMCLKLERVDAEKLRRHLLDKYEVGTIALGPTDLRIAFSCVEEEDLEELIDLVHQGVKDLS
jgi:aspartate/methionine/tyrosine aminotransferase